ncbi:MAG: ECF transporter S component, partial [Bacillota bacterium]|nr:ECF transporter S component [Bacillota bacterium]
MNTKELLYGALLTALALMIPLLFRGWLQIVIPPFTATLGSHVPVMLAMFVSPLVAALVGVGSAVGFLITLGPVV